MAAVVSPFLKNVITMQGLTEDAIHVVATWFSGVLTASRALWRGTGGVACLGAGSDRAT